jgi:hypothetical protein
MLYNFDIDKLIRWLLPVSIRKQPMIDWIGLLCGYAASLHLDFINFKTWSNLQVQKNGQAIVLEQIIKDEINGLNVQNPSGRPTVFDFEVNVIDYPYNVEALVCAKSSERLSTQDSPFCRQSVELGQTSNCAKIDELESPFDFQVEVDSTFFNEEKIRGIVDKYRNFGRTYKVVSI